MQEIVPVDYWHHAYSSSLGGGGGADILAPGLHHRGTQTGSKQGQPSNIPWADTVCEARGRGTKQH